jgi:hypothetical protein
MTVWACDAERESPMFDNIQIEIGCDETDIWLVFNKSASAVQMTHAEALEFMNQFSEALGEGRMLKQQAGETKGEDR